MLQWMRTQLKEEMDMNIKEELLQKYEEFATFLESIDLSSYTRQELMELKSQLGNIKMRNISFEMSDRIKEMKEEEFPQLRSVHHFPELTEIDFMSEKNKIALDNYLCMVRKGNYVFNLYKFTNNKERLQQFLVEKGVLEKVYRVSCPHHYNETLVNGLSKQKLEEFKQAVLTKNTEFFEDEHDELYCERCEDSPTYKTWNDMLVREDYVLLKNRDTSLDNV